MFKQRKGITPVIAIVLLLLVTVGAVGVVYTQFQNIASQGSTDASYLEEVNVRMSVVQRDRNGTARGTMRIVMRNTGTSTYNLSDIAGLRYEIPGEEPIRANSVNSPLFGYLVYNGSEITCFDKKATQTFAPGQTVACDTGVQMPSAAGEKVTIHLIKEGAETTSEIDKYECEPSTDSSTTC